MFSLLVGLWKFFFKRQDYHVLILGVDNAGKTTFLEKLKEIYSNHVALPPERIHPTVGLNIGRFTVSNCTLVFWDLGGQASLRRLWEKYYDETHIVIYVVDSTDQTRIGEVRESLQSIFGNVALSSVPILVLANKQDLANALSAKDLAYSLNLHELEGDDNVTHVHGISALTGKGIEEGITWLVSWLKSRARDIPESFTTRQMEEHDDCMQLPP